MTDERWWLGVDVGGTFTDLVAVSRTTGEVRDLKVLTTRPHQELGVLEAVQSSGVPIEQVDEIVHGHTQGINAVLSRAGAKTALLATRGHRDLMDLGRMDRQFGPNLYDPTWLRPHQARPLVPRRDRYGIRERIGYDGEVILSLDEEQVRTVARKLKADGIEAVAVCFLNSYVNQAHELRVADIVREEHPDAYVQTSALYPVTKEHERTTTVVMDAYVGPIVVRYLRKLEKDLQAIGFAGTLWIMTMNGGVGSIGETSKAPVFQLVSGPVGGVAGAVQLARGVAQQPNLLTMDVGGTSTDVAAIRDGETPLTDLWTFEHGMVMTAPVVDVISVGSGAGSIIGVTPLGSLHVGPESAGSTPGPASYGRGGTKPTLTDACVQLGILQPDLFAGGAIELQKDLATEALTTVGGRLGMSAMELADGAYRLACSDMAGALRSISVERGFDLREFGLLAFGAAGPMMATRVARELGLNRVVVPVHPGEFSAFGLVASDLKVSKAQSPFAPVLQLGAAGLEAQYQELEQDARAELLRQGVSADDIAIDRHLFAMYSGQTWDNRISIPGGTIDDEKLAAIIGLVHEFYEDHYGFTAEELPILISTVEVTASARRPALPDPAPPAHGTDSVIRHTTLHLNGNDHASVPVHARERLGRDDLITGPALVVERYATAVLDEHSSARLDAAGNLIITLDEKED